MTTFIWFEKYLLRILCPHVVLKVHVFDSYKNSPANEQHELNRIKLHTEKYNIWEKQNENWNKLKQMGIL